MPYFASEKSLVESAGYTLAVHFTGEKVQIVLPQRFWFRGDDKGIERPSSSRCITGRKT